MAHFRDYDGRTYSIALVTGTIAAGAGANSEIFQFRHVDATNLRKIRVLEVALTVAHVATAFTAGDASFEMSIARNWTGAGTGGSTATLTGNNQKLRTSQNTNILGVAGEIRFASTAALGAGTKTLDAHPIGSIIAPISTAVNVYLADPTYLYVDAEHRGPLVFGHQEGFAIRATVPATGTWRASMNLVWAETD